jgi:hypothetical protein
MKFSSMMQALIWEMLKRGRWSIPGYYVIGNAMPMLVYGSLTPLGLDPNAPELNVLQFAFLMIVVFIFAIGVALAHGNPSRLYASPISTRAIVGWHTVSGGVLLGIESASAAWLYNAIFGVDWPVLGAALFAVAAWAAFQVLLSITVRPQISMFALAICMVPCLLLGLWLASRYGSYWSPPRHRWLAVTFADWLCLMFATVACYALAVYSSQLARCGEPLPSLGISAWIAKRLEEWFSNRRERTFRSPLSAQRWHELQVKGGALPVGVAMMIGTLVVFGTAGCFTKLCSVADMYQGMQYMGASIVLWSVFAGGIFGLSMNPIAGQRERQLGETVYEVPSEWDSYLSSRPMTNQHFAIAILQAEVISLGAAWLVWFVPFFALCAWMGWSSSFPNPIHPSSIAIAKLGQLFFPMVVLGSWVVTSNLSAVGASGRGVHISIAAVAILAAYVVGSVVVFEFHSPKLTSQFYDWSASLIALIAVVGTVCAYYCAKQSKLVSKSSMLVAVTVVVAATVSGILIAPTGLRLRQHGWILGFASLIVLPFATLPLAIRWNRHR